MEEYLKNVLMEVLELDESTIEEIDNESDLIELGLDSLKAIELVVYIENEYDVAVDDDDLLIDNLATINNIINLINRYKD